MARIIHTDQLQKGQLDKQTAMFVYNGLDCAITAEVHQKLLPQIAEVESIYRFERDCLAPALEMQLRGTKIDLNQRSFKLDLLRRQRKHCIEALNYLGRNLFGLTLNPNSQPQLKDLFYNKLGITPIEVYDKGEAKESMSREVLEKLHAYVYARPFAQLVLRARDTDKKIQALNATIDSDGRMRSSYNVGATETGRWSSSKGAYGGGLNDQTWTKELRDIFVADDGYELFQADLEQAEARAVAYLAQDEKFIAACESGDLWTFACKLIWPGLDWSGKEGYNEDLAADKAVAEQKFFRHFSYRDMAKRGGHAFDYMASPRTVAKHLGIPVDVAEGFGRKWFQAFPMLRRWQQRTVQEVQTHGYLTTPFGRRRHFLGRLRDDSTLREAVAYRPQSTIADLLNLGLLDLWRKQDRCGLQLLKQVHDAVVAQYPIGQRDNVVALVRECLERPVPIHGREMVVPTDFTWGFNWGPQTKDNPDGLADYKPGQERSRQRAASNNILHRQVS